MAPAGTVAPGRTAVPGAGPLLAGMPALVVPVVEAGSGDTPEAVDSEAVERLWGRLHLAATVKPGNLKEGLSCAYYGTFLQIQREPALEC